MAESTCQMNTELAYRVWGNDIDQLAHQQMKHACELPVSVKGALMPDAHVGYGLPIGGVLATKNCVIPYAVGVDIACRVMLSVLDLPLEKFAQDRQKFVHALESKTRFGAGSSWKERKQHAVLDADWKISDLTAQLKDLAWSQLGTSGSGNHFVEFGEISFSERYGAIEPGTYLALVSHSGSRGPGAKIADYYSKLAMSLHPGLPKQYQQLAWLDLNQEGAEYWQAMELMGQFASANHHVIHESLLQTVGAEPLLQVENNHNYAWKEMHDGEELVVHRKGATPAGKGVLGYIPGSMTAPGFLVEGKGEPDSIDSCSHGAGRKMSRTQAKNSTTQHELWSVLVDHGVELLSAGLDESPHAYKNIEEVMQAQADLVRVLAKFQPRLVKMAPAGERPED